MFFSLQQLCLIFFKKCLEKLLNMRELFPWHKQTWHTKLCLFTESDPPLTLRVIILFFFCIIYAELFQQLCYFLTCKTIEGVKLYQVQLPAATSWHELLSATCQLSHDYGCYYRILSSEDGSRYRYRDSNHIETNQSTSNSFRHY